MSEKLKPNKPSLPQGTRDFGPDVVRKRQYILNTIKSVFELYGFQPLETPAMENLETLMGKYGDEGDKLVFKILNNGDLIKDIPLSELFKEHRDSLSEYASSQQDFMKRFGTAIKALPPNSEPAESPEVENLIRELFKRYLKDTYLTKRALKYDLTIPFARYVAMNHGQLTFPFKRYQIQPVWRADRPQRGRYREFYQCDADVVGSKSLLNEIELTNIYATVFERLKIPVEIRLNSRKVLAALAHIAGGTYKLTDITIAIDKLDKIGLEKVQDELKERGLNDGQVDVISQYLLIADVFVDNETTLQRLKELLGNSEGGLAGITELEHILAQTSKVSSANKIIIDPTLARGLNYYTGTIFEIKAIGVTMGSIGGGGRYDDLTGFFGVPNVPGVGISFGVDRIYDVMEELGLFDKIEGLQSPIKVLFFNLGEEESKIAYPLLQEVRSAGTAAEIFHEPQKFDKQFKYAEKKGIPFIIIIGSAEIAEKTAVVKDLRSGLQQKIAFGKLKEFLFV